MNGSADVSVDTRPVGERASNLENVHLHTLHISPDILSQSNATLLGAYMVNFDIYNVLASQLPLFPREGKADDDAVEKWRTDVVTEATMLNSMYDIGYDIRALFMSFADPHQEITTQKLTLAQQMAIKYIPTNDKQGHWDVMDIGSDIQLRFISHDEQHPKAYTYSDLVESMYSHMSEIIAHSNVKLSFEQDKWDISVSSVDEAKTLVERTRVIIHELQQPVTALFGYARDKTIFTLMSAQDEKFAEKMRGKVYRIPFIMSFSEDFMNLKYALMNSTHIEQHLMHNLEEHRSKGKLPESSLVSIRAIPESVPVLYSEKVLIFLASNIWSNFEKSIATRNKLKPDRRDEKPELHIDFTRETREAGQPIYVITIQDNGNGFPPNLVREGQFVSGLTDWSAVEKGTGLGMFGMDLCTQAVGGRIVIENRTNKLGVVIGAIIRIELPILAPKEYPHSV